MSYFPLKLRVKLNIFLPLYWSSLCPYESISHKTHISHTTCVRVTTMFLAPRLKHLIFQTFYLFIFLALFLFLKPQYLVNIWMTLLFTFKAFIASIPFFPFPHSSLTPEKRVLSTLLSLPG